MDLIKKAIKEVNKWYDGMDDMFKFLLSMCLGGIGFIIAFAGSGWIESIGLLYYLALLGVRGYYIFVLKPEEEFSIKSGACAPQA